MSIKLSGIDCGDVYLTYKDPGVRERERLAFEQELAGIRNLNQKFFFRQFSENEQLSKEEVGSCYSSICSLYDFVSSSDEFGVKAKEQYLFIIEYFLCTSMAELSLYAGVIQKIRGGIKRRTGTHPTLVRPVFDNLGYITQIDDDYTRRLVRVLSRVNLVSMCEKEMEETISNAVDFLCYKPLNTDASNELYPARGVKKTEGDRFYMGRLDLFRINPFYTAFDDDF